MSKNIFGTGAAACVGAECSLDVPESYDLAYLDCYFDVDGQSTTVAGQAAFTITMNPNATPWIQPVAMAITVVDSTDPQLDQMVWFTAVQVHGCFQWLINETTPTAATTRIVPSSKYDPRNRNGCACPVCFDVYSNEANTRQLSLSGFNPNPAGTTARVIVNMHGKSCGSVPPDCVGGPRKPGFKRVPTPVLTGSGRGAIPL